MYHYIRRQVIDIVTTICNKKVHDNLEIAYKYGIPYFSCDKFLSLEGCYSTYTLIKIFRWMTKIYGTEIFYDVAHNYPNTYSDYNNEQKGLSLDDVVVNAYWHDNASGRIIFTINNTKMYKVIDNELYRTFLWYLTDPLAYIADIERNVSHLTANFFRTVKHNIKLYEFHNILTHWTLMHSHITDFLILDITKYILKLYIQLLIHHLIDILDHIKMELHI